VLKKIIGFVSLLLSGAWWLGIGREFIKAIIFDRILHMVNPDVWPIATITFQYGPPILLAALGLYLLISESSSSLHTTSTDATHRQNFRRAAILSKLRNKYPQRIIAAVTPEYLMDLYKGQMTIDGDRAAAPFIGNWLLLSGPIRDVSRSRMNDGIITFNPHGMRLIFMYFDDQIDRLSVLRPKQNIWVFCQLKEATKLDVHFEHCELLDQDDPELPSSP